MKPGEEAENKREGDKREMRAKESQGKKEEGDRLGQRRKARKRRQHIPGTGRNSGRMPLR